MKGPFVPTKGPWRVSDQRGDIGPESQPGDYAYQKPVLWGTNRQGPDPSHVASRPYITREWQVLRLAPSSGARSGALT